jgi:hypothetical protein
MMVHVHVAGIWWQRRAEGVTVLLFCATAKGLCIPKGQLWEHIVLPSIKAWFDLSTSTLPSSPWLVSVARLLQAPPRPWTQRLPSRTLDA